ncbi:MAG: hypothetical protein LQ338_003112 [Usnochroma carphineum]|nr:MAG: hypothetical protein LQ338_003112 [Usnochroma carphineum]
MPSTAGDTPADGEIVAAPFPTLEQGETQPPLSKNKLKKLRRDKAWEEGRDRRKELRKIKNKERKERKRAAADNNAPSEATQEKRKASNGAEFQAAKKPNHCRSVQLPISFVLDCGFDDLMLDGERKSLASQVTRSYSENQKALYRPHLFISSFKGHLKERFDTVLSGHHHSWKGVRFLEGDFEEAAKQADQVMKDDQGGKLAGAFEQTRPAQQTEEGSGSGEVVYLTSDSPDTLTELKPYSTYIIGGLVDKNRHKGICYKRAMDRGLKTAKLPIGDYMKMSSRFVLATNHVVEIMLQWLEVGDWAKAFLQIMPKRKGGIPKDGLTIPDRSPAASTNDGRTDNEASGRNQGKGETADMDDAESVQDKATAENMGSGEQRPPQSEIIGQTDSIR